MVLENQSSSMHNRLAGTKVPHSPATNFDQDSPSPSPKRLKRLPGRIPQAPKDENNPSGGTAAQKRSALKHEIPDSEDEDCEDGGMELPNLSRPTQLESVLPAIQTEKEAIEAYEAYRAGEELSSETKSRIDGRPWTPGQSSIYVDAFNLALFTVLEEEAHLFNEAELVLFEEWKALDYAAQYLYVRLFLRKTSKWFRVKDLQYYGDIADLESTVATLQLNRPLPGVDAEPVQKPGELDPPEGMELGTIFTFAECSADRITSLDEASSLLLLEELKTIAKDARIHGKSKKELLHNLRRTSGKQKGLGFRSLPRTETEESTGSVTSEDSRSNYNHEDSDHGTSNRDAHYTKKILEQTGRCIRLSLTPLKLFERVHLVFYRDTEWTEKSLTTLILAKISRRNFPDYIVSRSNTIFESRTMLLEFEASLRTQFYVDNILEFNGTPGRKDLEQVKSVFEQVYPRWKVLVAEERRKEDRVYDRGEGAYLRRFNPAWVYTRIIHKALHPLARFKEHGREHQLLSELLKQRLFHAARRGAWYQRKALLEEHYIHELMPAEGRNEDANKKHWKRVALRTCETGLEDHECHIIYHYDLQKRIRKLEKQLRLPVREQHDFGHVRLSKALERNVYGIKIERDDTPAHMPRRNSMPGGHCESRPGAGAKTVWLDELDTQLPVSVESMCLSHYRKELGWKGYHSEGGILRCLFGLLFCDVLFAYVPNVFQTAYQTCPLDLHTDSFYPARISEINARINEIGNGDAEWIVRQTWEAHFERRTCVVGIRWDDYDLGDIVEIARCFSGEALGIVMRVMAQEYAARGGGVPDLFLWKPAGDGKGGEVMFAEIKSENDRLSDTQRLWISVLLGAGIQVELCHALAKEVRTAD
jgi:fanconi-associated nuclease 1